MKWTELIKIAEARGYQFVKPGKKHDIYMNESGEMLIVERHSSQEVRKGLMNRIKKQLGL